MIKDIDKSDVIDTHLIQGSVLGSISTKEISGGVKTWLLMKAVESSMLLPVGIIVRSES